MSNGAADKPRKSRKPQALPPEVGLIRVAVRRFAPRRQRIVFAAPLSQAQSVRQQYNIHRQPSDPEGPAMPAVPRNAPVATRRG